LWGGGESVAGRFAESRCMSIARSTLPSALMRTSNSDSGDALVNIDDRMASLVSVSSSPSVPSFPMFLVEFEVCEDRRRRRWTRGDDSSEIWIENGLRTFHEIYRQATISSPFMHILQTFSWHSLTVSTKVVQYNPISIYSNFCISIHRPRK